MGGGYGQCGSLRTVAVSDGATEETQRIASLGEPGDGNSMMPDGDEPTMAGDVFNERKAMLNWTGTEWTYEFPDGTIVRCASKSVMEDFLDYVEEKNNGSGMVGRNGRVGDGSGILCPPCVEDAEECQRTDCLGHRANRASGSIDRGYQPTAGTD